jgi:hypothetical protein
MHTIQKTMVAPMLSFSALKLAVLVVSVDIVLSTPLIVLTHWEVLDSRDLQHEILSATLPFWSKAHVPMEVILTRVMYTEEIHHVYPAWYPIAFYLGCFAQTFLLSFALFWGFKKLTLFTNGLK